MNPNMISNANVEKGRVDHESKDGRQDEIRTKLGSKAHQVEMRR